MSVEKATAILRWDPDIRRCIVTGEALRRMGFDYDSFCVGFDEIDGIGTAFIALTVQGRTADIAIGRPPYSKAEFGQLYSDVADSIVDISDDELDRAWDSVFGDNDLLAELILALIQAGFDPPCRSAMENRS